MFLSVNERLDESIIIEVNTIYFIIKKSTYHFQKTITIKHFHQTNNRLNLMSTQCPLPATLLTYQSQQLIQTIQIKQKKITYLQSQLKTLKQQYSSRLELIQKAYNELKKENHLLERRFVEDKQLESIEWQEKIRKVNQENRATNVEKKIFYDKMIKEKEERFQETLRNVQLRYESVVEKLKEQNKTLQNILLSKTPSLQSTMQLGKQFTFGTEDYKYLSVSPNISNITFKDLPNESLQKEKSSTFQELITLKQKHEKTVKELETERKINLEMQNDHRMQKMELEEELSMMRKEIDSWKKRVRILEEEKEHQKKLLMEKIMDLERRNQRIHSHTKQVEQTYLLALTNRTRQQKPSPVTAIKTCNHSGLISQLQRNLSLKDQQIDELNAKIHHLQKMLGIDKSINERFHEIGNVTDRTQQIYRSQKEKIFNKTMKLGGKK